MAAEDPTGTERRFEPWPIGLALALASMIGISLTFFAVATRNPDALVVEDAYAAGLQYNAQVRERARVEALGLHLEIEALGRDDRGVRLHVAALDREGGRIAAERVEVRRERPAEGGLDQSFDLQPSGDAYAGLVPLPRPGRWHLVVTAIIDGAPVRETFVLRGT